MSGPGPSMFGQVLRKLKQGELLTSLRKRLAWKLRSRHERYLDGAKGVIHVGANIGQERHTYALCGLPVIWLEAGPQAYATLLQNIAGFPRQRAFQCLVTDVDGGQFEFHIASNGGGSSSIHGLEMHRDIWPNVEFTETVQLESKTLATLLREKGVDPEGFDVLVMDTQGSELLVLKGAEPLLRNFRYVRTEAADFDAYAGGCRLQELSAFLHANGFVEVRRQPFAAHPGGGRYYDVLFRRERPG